MTAKYISYTRQHIDDSDIAAVAEALRQDLITRGIKVAEFEQEIASACKAKWAVAFNSGSSALFAAFYAADVSPKDRFITTSNSFVASAGAVQRTGTKPYFTDIDVSTGNMCLDSLKQLCDVPRSRGRLVITPVHFAGIALDMHQLDCLLKTPDVIVIEDAAHAFGSFYPDGQPVGCCAYSQMTVFSFHPAKNITTGEGGIVTTNDDELYYRLRCFRDNGIDRENIGCREEEPWYYECHELTGNFHMTEMQAALGLSQLKKLAQFVEKRRILVARYRRNLEKEQGIRLFSSDADGYTAFHLMVAQIDFSSFNTDRKTVMDRLREKGIGTQVHYIPLYRHPVFSKKFHFEYSDFPKMETYYSQALSLPLCVDLNEEEVDFICESLLETLRQ